MTWQTQVGLSDTGCQMLDFFRGQFDHAWEKPFERLLKPGIKAVALIGLLTGTARLVNERRMDRASLAQLAAKSGAQVRNSKAFHSLGFDHRCREVP
jgi:hypothetical protein